jgi:hypothetical protein
MQGLNSIANTEQGDRGGDVIFVHGLEGDARGTWHPAGRPEAFWPAWLGEELPGVGIWSLGYELHASAWLGGTMPLADRATETLHLLETHGIGARPLVFVTHSFGGLLVKQMLRHARDFGQPGWQAIAGQTKGVVFLSTPHSGSNVANWARYVRTVLRLSETVEELRAHDSRLRELSTWYRQAVDELGIQTRVYYEKQATRGVLVVDPTSAEPGLKGVIPIPLDADHLTICKPESKDALVYRSVKQFIERCLAPQPAAAAAPGAAAASQAPGPAASAPGGQLAAGGPAGGATAAGPVGAGAGTEAAPKVFISYSHDSEAHAARVLELADRLSQDGMTVVLDQYVHPAPAEGWPLWMERNLDEVRFVLLVCTETYHRRVMRQEKAGQGRGVQWEGNLIYNRLYGNLSQGTRYLPVLLDDTPEGFIPTPVQGYTHYRLRAFELSDQGYVALIRHLTDQAAAPPPPPGQRPVLPTKPRPGLRQNPP